MNLSIVIALFIVKAQTPRWGGAGRGDDIKEESHSFLNHCIGTDV
jgi:hypothetical protein